MTLAEIAETLEHQARLSHGKDAETMATAAAHLRSMAAESNGRPRNQPITRMNWLLGRIIDQLGELQPLVDEVNEMIDDHRRSRKSQSAAKSTPKLQVVAGDDTVAHK